MNFALAAASRASTVSHARTIHFAPTVDSVNWDAGHGIMTSPTGIRLGLTIEPTAKVAHKVVVNERTRTITITLDASIKGASQPVVAPMEKFIPLQRPRSIGSTYTIVVKGTNGRLLAPRTTFVNHVPA